MCCGSCLAFLAQEKLDADLARIVTIEVEVQAARRRIPAQPGRAASDGVPKVSGTLFDAVFLFGVESERGFGAEARRNPKFSLFYSPRPRASASLFQNVNFAAS